MTDTTYTYDGNGNRLSKTTPYGVITHYQYDAEDRLIQTIDPNGNTQTIGYDAAGRVVSMTDGLGNTQRHQLDGSGHVIKSFDANGKQIAVNAYNSRGLLEESTDGTGRMTDWQYDTRGLLVGFVDGLLKQTFYGYDALGRLTAVKDPLGILTSQGYDGDGNRVKLTNGLSQETQFGFDTADRLVTVKTATGNTTQYSYNSRNLIATEALPNGAKSVRTYDSVGRLSQLSDGFATTKYTYDRNGRNTKINDTIIDINGEKRNREVLRSYDVQGRLLKYTDSQHGEINYNYDQAGNMSEAGAMNYEYDANNRLISVEHGSLVTKYSYDNNGRLIKTQFPNGVVETRSYDLSGHLVSMLTVNSKGSVIYSSKSILDASGRVIRESISPPPSLTSPSTMKLTVDADNRVVSYNGQPVSYDAAGNLIKGPLPTGAAMSEFSYDGRNQLSKGSNINYQYDPDGIRTEIMITENQISKHQTFLIDPNGSFDKVVGRWTENNQTDYIYGLGLIAEEDGYHQVYRQYQFDSHGNTIALTDAQGNVTDRFEYGPYGETILHTGTSDTPFQYRGFFAVQTDPNGLLYMRGRYYNPLLRRFMNQSPRFGSTDPGITLNRFVFAEGNPIALSDSLELRRKSRASSSFGEFLLGPSASISNSDDEQFLNFLNPFKVIPSYRQDLGGRDDLFRIQER
jgi:RHS repeat-associated protein